jgi:hypothetical protein
MVYFFFLPAFFLAFFAATQITPDQFLVHLHSVKTEMNLYS